MPYYNSKSITVGTYRNKSINSSESLFLTEFIGKLDILTDAGGLIQPILHEIIGQSANAK